MSGVVDDGPVARATLYRTASGGRLHVRGCSHLTWTAADQLLAATPTDRAEAELCAACDDEIHGRGRTVFASLDAAFEALNLHVANRARMREIAAHVDFDVVWAPASRSYVGAGFDDGRPAAAYFNRGFVDVYRGPNDYERTEMPNFGGGGGGAGARRAPEREAATCPSCSMQLPAAGTCDYCD
ncbi:hypothetical protein ACFWFR_08275 [Oerskovia sp. NPDC060287]|uniref:hypothetical protein n=1 Tax=Oerskovia sp. NPDC060287 TaxID=3347095 RepID=UPI00365D61B4